MWLHLGSEHGGARLLQSLLFRHCDRVAAPHDVSGAHQHAVECSLRDVDKNVPAGPCAHVFHYGRFVNKFIIDSSISSVHTSIIDTSVVFEDRSTIGSSVSFADKSIIDSSVSFVDKSIIDSSVSFADKSTIDSSVSFADISIIDSSVSFADKSVIVSTRVSK